MVFSDLNFHIYIWRTNSLGKLYLKLCTWYNHTAQFNDTSGIANKTFQQPRTPLLWIA
jgi:hypothetical protein